MACLTIEIDVIISILKLTRSGPVSHLSIKKYGCTASDVVQKMLRKMQHQELVFVEDGNVQVNSLQRLKLAVCALKAGADFERVSRFLSWKEFEDVTAATLEQHGYAAVENLHFKHLGRKWEIDVVGCKGSLIVCIDCKHWRRGPYRSTLKRMVEEQVRRTSALADSLPSPKSKIQAGFSNTLILLPAILSLGTSRFKFHDNVPVVPILQLQDFLRQLPAHMNTLKHFKARWQHLTSAP